MSNNKCYLGLCPGWEVVWSVPFPKVRSVSVGDSICPQLQTCRLRLVEALKKEVCNLIELIEVLTKLFKVGDPLPNVELFEDAPNNKVNIADMVKGKRVVIFGVPGAFTPGCTKVCNKSAVYFSNPSGEIIFNIVTQFVTDKDASSRVCPTSRRNQRQKYRGNYLCGCQRSFCNGGMGK